MKKFMSNSLFQFLGKLRSCIRRNSQWWFQNQITFLWAVIKGGRGNSKIYLINENDMDTMYSQYAEAQKIQLWCDGRSVLVYIAQWLPYKSVNKAFFFNYEVLEVMSCDTPSSLLYFQGVWEITRDISPYSYTHFRLTTLIWRATIMLPAKHPDILRHTNPAHWLMQPLSHQLQKRVMGAWMYCPLLP